MKGAIPGLLTLRVLDPVGDRALRLCTALARARGRAYSSPDNVSFADISVSIGSTI